MWSVVGRVARIPGSLARSAVGCELLSAGAPPIDAPEGPLRPPVATASRLRDACSVEAPREHATGTIRRGPRSHPSYCNNLVAASQRLASHFDTAAGWRAGHLRLDTRVGNTASERSPCQTPGLRPRPAIRARKPIILGGAIDNRQPWSLNALGGRFLSGAPNASAPEPSTRCRHREFPGGLRARRSSHSCEAFPVPTTTRRFRCRASCDDDPRRASRGGSFPEP